MAFGLMISCENSGESEGDVSEADILIETDNGEIYLKLYDETPRHKENFLKLAGEGFFDGMSFHRVIRNFMVQTGDPRTIEGSTAEGDDAGYRLEEEISMEFIHTEGKVAAARYPNEVNPKWESSSSQFYIVTGGTVTEENLDIAEEYYSSNLQNKLYVEYKEKLDAGEVEGDFNDYLADIGFIYPAYTEAQRIAYRGKRGTPNLDFQYTIFGEVVKGMDVVRTIEMLPTTGAENFNVPTKTVRMISVKPINQ
ncbi:MAG: peptidylprolyl isomerase [Bacteroidota bacterium]